MSAVASTASMIPISTTARPQLPPPLVTIPENWESIEFSTGFLGQPSANLVLQLSGNGLSSCKRGVGNEVALLRNVSGVHCGGTSSSKRRQILPNGSGKSAASNVDTFLPVRQEKVQRNLPVRGKTGVDGGIRNRCRKTGSKRGIDDGTEPAEPKNLKKRSLFEPVELNFNLSSNSDEEEGCSARSSSAAATGASATASSTSSSSSSSCSSSEDEDTSTSSCCSGKVRTTNNVWLRPSYNRADCWRLLGFFSNSKSKKVILTENIAEC